MGEQKDANKRADPRLHVGHEEVQRLQRTDAARRLVLCRAVHRISDIAGLLSVRRQAGKAR
jgi:hypothetical protein